MSDSRRTEHTLLASTDAMVWAQEFCRIFTGYTVRESAPPSDQAVIDIGGMVAWFASALETGRDAGRREVCSHPYFHEVSEEMRLCTTCGQAKYGPAWGPDHPDYDEMGQ